MIVNEKLNPTELRKSGDNVLFSFSFFFSYLVGTSCVLSALSCDILSFSWRELSLKVN